MSVDVKLETRILDSLAKNFDGNVDKVLGDLAKQTVALAITRTPRDPARPPKDPSQPTTGQLRAGNNFEQVKVGLWRAYNNVEYAIYQELGTSRMPARPFLLPAMYRVYEQVTRSFYGILK
jgi:HK97 gp10 family phage protein